MPLSGFGVRFQYFGGRVQGFGVGVWHFGVRFQGFGFRVWDFSGRVQGLQIQGSGFRFEGSGFRGQGFVFGFRVQGSRVSDAKFRVSCRNVRPEFGFVVGGVGVGLERCGFRARGVAFRVEGSYLGVGVEHVGGAGRNERGAVHAVHDGPQRNLTRASSLGLAFDHCAWGVCLIPSQGGCLAVQRGNGLITVPWVRVRACRGVND